MNKEQLAKQYHDEIMVRMLALANKQDQMKLEYDLILSGLKKHERFTGAN